MAVANYIAAIVFTILWAIGFFAHLAGSVIHLLLIAAFALILINILYNDNKPDTKDKHLTS